MGARISGQSPRTYGNSSTDAHTHTHSGGVGGGASSSSSPPSATGDASQGFNLLRTLPGFQQVQNDVQNMTQVDRQRARSLSSVPDIHHNHHQTGVTSSSSSSSNNYATVNNNSAAPQSHTNYMQSHQRYHREMSTAESIPLGGTSTPGAPNDFGRVYTSLPSHIWTFNGIKCPVCNKLVLPDDIECHLVICLTKPRLSYNEDVLSDAKGECVICLEELNPGDIIARLPCLCIYHKGCIDRWFEVNRSCPEHPGD